MVIYQTNVLPSSTSISSTSPWNHEDYSHFHVVHGKFGILYPSKEFEIELNMRSIVFVSTFIINPWFEINTYYNRNRHLISLVLEYQATLFFLQSIQILLFHVVLMDLHFMMNIWICTIEIIAEFTFLARLLLSQSLRYCKYFLNSLRSLMNMKCFGKFPRVSFKIHRYNAVLCLSLWNDRKDHRWTYHIHPYHHTTEIIQLHRQ